MRGLARGGDNDAEAVLRRPRGRMPPPFPGSGWALITCASTGMPSAFRVSMAFPTTGRSLSLPMMTATFLEFSVIAFVLSSQSGTEKNRLRHARATARSSCTFPRTRALDATASEHLPTSQTHVDDLLTHLAFIVLQKSPKIARRIPLPAKFVELEGESEADTGDFVYFADLCRLPKKFRIFSLGFTPSIVYNVV